MKFFNSIFNKAAPKATDTNNWIADVSVAGLQHYRGNDLAELIKEGDTLLLKQQPGNAYDEHAIMVMWHNNKLGYIPKSVAREINRKLEAGNKVEATILELKAIKFGRKWIKVRLSVIPSK